MHRFTRRELDAIMQREPATNEDETQDGDGGSMDPPVPAALRAVYGG